MASVGQTGVGIGRIFQRKSVAQIQAEHEHGELKRTLGALNLVLLGIGCIIGTGIFVLTGTAAARFSGPAITISFIITGTLCAFVALCYAELASALPVSGSAYSYSYASMGEIAAWVMGILLITEYGLSASTVAVGWSGYFVSLLQDNLGIHIPQALTAAPGVPIMDSAGHVIGSGVVNLPAIGIVAAVTALLVVGITESARVNNIIVAIKLTVVIAFIAIGAFFVHPSNLSPLVPAEVPPPPPGTPMDLGSQILRAVGNVFTGDSHSKYGVGGVITGAARIFFAYLGFEAVSTAGAESRNPSKDMPVGIIGSLVICTTLYILTSAVLVGIVPYAQLDTPAPIALAVNHIGMPWFAVLVKIGAIAGLTSVMLVLLYGQTRIFYTMSRDGLLPRLMSIIHQRFRTPWINTIIVGMIACGAAGFLTIDNLADLSNVGSLTAFGLVCVTVIYLRITSPGLERPFRTPLYPVVPVLGALMCFVLLRSILNNKNLIEFMGLKFTIAQFFFSYVTVGFLVYFTYGLWNSKLRKGVTVDGHEPPPMELPRRDG
jgi:basic amino acid/polyamine antiporter, APA family